jgi:hypothetical protein
MENGKKYIFRVCLVCHTVDAEYLGEAGPETEFLEITLTKDSSLLLHAFHSLFYSGIKKKHTKKSTKLKNSSLFIKSIL